MAGGISEYYLENSEWILNQKHLASDVEVNRISWCMDSHVISPQISEKIASYYWEIIYVSKSVQELLFLGHSSNKVFIFSGRVILCAKDLACE